VYIEVFMDGRGRVGRKHGEGGKNPLIHSGSKSGGNKHGATEWEGAM
jgi:hypothetical protein